MILRPNRPPRSSGNENELPFCNQLEKLAVITVRDKRLKPGKQDPHAVLLDERLLLSPSFAIAECRNATTKMAGLVRDTILDAIGLLSHFDSATAEKIDGSGTAVPGTYSSYDW